MIDRQFAQQDEELAQRLTALGDDLLYPAAPDLVPAVRARLLTQPQQRRWSWRTLPWSRRAVALVCVLVVFFGVVLALSPTARARVGVWLKIPGLVIQYEPAGIPTPAATPRQATPTTPIGERLFLGEPVDLATARQRVAYPLLTPSLPVPGPPDEVYLSVPPVGGQVTLVWWARPDLPGTVSSPDVGLLLSQFQGRLPEYWRKAINAQTILEYPLVSGSNAIWITGGPHSLIYNDAMGQIRQETTRLVGNVLLWEYQGVTYRMEGARTREEAIAIAESLR